MKNLIKKKQKRIFEKQFLFLKCSIFLILLFGGIQIAPAGNEMKNLTQQSGKTIIGSVFDTQTKEPLVGVSVSIKGTNIGTLSDINGKFSIRAPYEEAILIFSYLGFRPQQIELQGRNSLEVGLLEDIQALDEVVVVGYTTQKRENITGAVATITTKDLVQSPTANINNALAGRLPGLIVNQFTGGEPGVDRAELFVRGKSTYGDQSPIVIVDGVEREMSYLAPEEIETFTILKDAASTAPYGIRGANGVIVITTKRGSASEKTTVNFKAAVGVNQIVKKPSLLGSADYTTLYNEAMINDAMMRGTNPDNLKLFSEQAISDFKKAKGDNSDGLGYNWDYFDYMFKDSPQQNYDLTVSGGTDKVRYISYWPVIWIRKPIGIIVICPNGMHLRNSNDIISVPISMWILPKSFG
jgi:TonB-linked SusC/RagA family outer membrane protein